MLLRSSHPSRPRRARLLAPLAVVAVLTTACGSADEGTAAPDPAPSPTTSMTAPSSSSPSPASAAAGSSAPSSAPAVAEPVTITISGFEYDVPDSVPAGAELSVVNEDAEAHTFTVRDGGSVVVQGGGMTATIAAPAAAGTYEVVCDFHGGMTATLVVT